MTIAKLSQDARMLSTVITGQRNQFQTLAEAWMMAGATTFSVWAEGSQLAVWPKGAEGIKPSMKAPIRLNGGNIGELRVEGTGNPAAEKALIAEAGFVSRLVKMEKELKGMTERLIDTQDQLLAVYGLTEATRNNLDMDELLKQLAQKSTQLESCEGAFLLLKVSDKSFKIEHYPQIMLDDELIQSCLEKVTATKSEFLLNLSETEYGRAGLRNLLFVPIVIRDQVSAAIGLLNKKDGDFLSPDIKLARVIAEHAGSRMEHLILFQESIEQSKLQIEAELAKKVQLRLLPKTFPDVPGIDLWAGSKPASQVGGDFYAFVSNPNRPFTFCVGDVSGKGMPAALLMAMSRTVMRTKTNVTPTPTPEVILDECNTELYDDFTEVSMFATAFVGQFHNNNQFLKYANAGHSPVVFCPFDGPPVLLEADGTALGVLPTSLAEDQSLEFRKGDVLVVATDGFSEASNHDDELFGYDRFLKVIKMLSKKSAKGIFDGLFETINNFSAGRPQDDDQTMLVLKAV
ncbi:MAG: sigma-B regulation protein RsbU (phosphoserine phosphatase) [Cellvibrionaceae bacterium]|jgi:sigma-B regulation protein RsbU (phosphoserine phosphatase)